jgi:hypothetical protein
VLEVISTLAMDGTAISMHVIAAENYNNLNNY